MMMILVSNLGYDPCLQLCVQFVFGSRVAVCDLAMVVFHDDRRGWLYRLWPISR
jgi:hypothetical protein